MSGRVWTIELIDELKRLRARGRTFGQIARRLGVSRSAAIGKAMRLGLAEHVTVAPVRATPAPAIEPAALGGERDMLGRRVCHWIHGDPAGPWRMCGHKAVHGRLWCAHHLARVFVCVGVPTDGAAQDAA